MGHSVAVSMVEPWSSVGAAAAWVTVNVAVAPPAVNVNVPTRWEVEALAAALTVTAAPDAPEVGVAASQDVSDDAAQDAAFVVGTTVLEPPAAGADHDDADNDKVAAGTVAVIV
jgi:hypothetical protein